MAENSSTSTLRRVQDKLDQLWTFVDRHTRVIDDGESHNQIRYLQEHWQALRGMVDGLPHGRDSGETVTQRMGDIMDWLFRELDPIVQRLRVTAPSTVADPGIEIFRKRIQLIGCKVEHHIEVLRVDGIGGRSYGDWELLWLPLRLTKLQELNAELSSQISKLESDLDESKADESEANEEIVAELKSQLADSLCRLKEFDKAAKICQELYNSLNEKVRKLRSGGDGVMATGAQRAADEAKRESFRIGHLWVTALMGQDYSRERYSEAAGIAKTIVEEQTTLLSEYDPQTIKSYQQYFRILGRQAVEEKHLNPQMSEGIYHELEGIHSRIYGRRDAAGLLSQNCKWRLYNGHELGLVLAHQGHYDNAEIQLTRVWNDRKREGAPHDDILASALQIVELRLKMERQEPKPQNIQKIYKVLTTTFWQQSNDEASDKILSLVYELGSDLYSQRRHEDAGTILQAVWEVSKTVRGATSLRTVDVAHLLGLALYSQKNYNGVRTVLETVWEARHTALKKIPSTMESIGFHLASALYHLENYSSAEPVIRQVWEWKKQAPGPGSPETLKAQRLYGMIMIQLKRYKEAKGILEPLWKIERGGNAANSEKTFEIGHELGKCQLKCREFSSAVETLKIVYRGRHSIGADINDTKDLLTQAQLKKAGW